MKASDGIASFLAREGCGHVFGVPGGAATHILDSLYRIPEIQFVGMCHEQAAAFAAEGYARAGRRLGAAMATSGPGATNMITGIGSAYFDSIPCLYLTGQVNTYEYKGDLQVRQLGFQETDIVKAVAGITKYAVQIREPVFLRYELEKAVTIARTGRMGPVLVDIPMDVQRAEVDWEKLLPFEPEDTLAGMQVDCREAFRLISQSSRPVIIAGGGIRLAGADQILGEIAALWGIPVVCSLMGRDAFDNTQENFFGMIGVYGNRYANLAVANADCIIALGTRLDSRQTGTNIASFARGAALIRVDIDPNELSRKIKENELTVQSDAKRFLEKLKESTRDIDRSKWEQWKRILKGYKEQYPSYARSGFDPNRIVREISLKMNENSCVCLDVGQNQIWAAQSMCISRGQRMLTSGGMGAMGFSLPAAIGAFFGRPRGEVIAMAGDGGMQMNIQELETVKRYDIPIKIIVLNNHCLGMIRQFQEQYFESKYCGTILDYSEPAFFDIAKAYGIKSIVIRSERELDGVPEMLAAQGPLLIEVNFPQKTVAYPKLSMNRPIEDQEPLVGRDELRKNMIIKPLEF